MKAKIYRMDGVDVLWQGTGTYCHSLAMDVWVKLVTDEEVRTGRSLGYDIRKLDESDLRKMTDVMP